MEVWSLKCGQWSGQQGASDFVGVPIGRRKRFDISGFFVTMEHILRPTLRAASGRPYESVVLHFKKVLDKIENLC